MQRLPALLVLTSLYLSGVNAADTATDMGPAAFLWPPDRTWGAAQDNTAPCGSSAGVTNRTDFPLSKLTISGEIPQTLTCVANGKVSLVLQDESYRVNLAISYDNGYRLHPKRHFITLTTNRSNLKQRFHDPRLIEQLPRS